MELLTKNEYAYRRLHDDILSGKLPSGSRLIVKDLVEEYQVSAMPVRNAIARLEELGLVHTAPHQGAWVSEVNLSDYFTFMVLRIEAEALAAYLAAHNRDDSLIQELETLLHRMEIARDSNDYETYGRINRKSHVLVCQACGNPTLIDHIDMLVSRTQLAVSLFSVIPKSSSESCEEHRDLVSALRNRDSHLSAAIIRYQRCRSNLGLISSIRAGNANIQDNHLLWRASSTEAGRQCIETFAPIFAAIKEQNDYSKLK